MTRTLYDTAAATLAPYPRADDADVVGLDPRYLVLLVQQDPQPTYDTATQRLDPTTNIDLDARVVRRGWAVMTLPPPEPEPQWIAFSEAIVAIPSVVQVLAASFTANPGLYGGLVVGLGQAAQGDPRTFLRFWQLSISAGLIQPALAAQIQQLAGTYNLPAAFVSGLQSPGLPPIQPGGVQSFGGLGTTVLITNPLPPQQ